MKKMGKLLEYGGFLDFQWHLRERDRLGKIHGHQCKTQRTFAFLARWKSKYGKKGQSGCCMYGSTRNLAGWVDAADDESRG